MRLAFGFSLLAVVLLSACSRQSVAQSIDPQKTYQGYPCFETCTGFRAGYDSAKSQKVFNKSGCDAYSEAERLGCQAYVNGMEIDTMDNGGFKLAP